MRDGMVAGRRSRVLGLVVAVLAVVGVACRPLPPIPVPDPPPAGLEPGDILATEASRLAYLFTTEPMAGTEAWRILYRSEDVHGNPIDVTGTVIAPTAPWTGPGDRPLVSYAPGTRGLGDDCAPSGSLANGWDYESLFVANLVSRGWAVVVTDYEGLGTEGRHTYMVGESQGQAVLNAARAAQSIDGTDLTAASPVGLMGYSQGGGASMWAAELAADYAPELDIVGAVGGGTPANLVDTSEHLDGGLFIAFVLLAGMGTEAAYPELDLKSYLNAEGLDLYDTAEEFCITSVDGFATLLGNSFTEIDDYLNTNIFEDPLWIDRLERSSLGSNPPESPVYLYHGVWDEVAPFESASELRAGYCAAGVDVEWNPLVLAEHVLGLVLGHQGGVDWLAARFAGEPAPNNC